MRLAELKQRSATQVLPMKLYSSLTRVQRVRTYAGMGPKLCRGSEPPVRLYVQMERCLRVRPLRV